ncbi:uncharacterized protein BYT42DRAFT_611723 [Radiomyces spectabilis]|uniref:uncharacterized protein n=1 Tax=Radiomyces spectabilis TaxID=64574 RepID=UPI00222015D5|nr:uncharacterized protein BYT42DRAFT_611723 [Radiomyces spectabilis]KAI8388712.1 hypothetical protein BYT42DRAFT_611723 [Radiomyces spectabilis]
MSDTDALADEFNEKAELRSNVVEDDDFVDEKEALRQQQQQQHDIDQLLSDLPDDTPDVKNDSEQQQEAKSKERDPRLHTVARNDSQFQKIFKQFDSQQEELNIKPDSASSKPAVETDTSIERKPSGHEPKKPSISDLQKTVHVTAPPQRQEIPFDFNKFLEQMKRRSAMPITRYFKSFLQAFDRRPWSVKEQIKIIQDFLDFIYVKMRECEVWRDVSDQEFENAKEGMEKLVMNRLYHATFSPSTTDDKERDEILHQKISIFRWIREEHLDIPVTSHNASFMTFAESELLKINNYKAPRDKLICVLNCCKVIFGLIKHVEGDAGADKFLPVLIYVVIRANPPRLVSNIQNPEQLQSEAGYYLTNLLGAVTFIETMEANSLSITKEEFDANIERTMNELEQERPSITHDKRQISYDNVVHPSQSPQVQTPLLIDPVKAAALLEKGSNFAQKTMQKPLDFVGKILQGLGENTPLSTSPPEQQREATPVPDDEEARMYRERARLYYEQQQQQLHGHSQGRYPGGWQHVYPGNMPYASQQTLATAQLPPQATHMHVSERRREEMQRAFDDKLKTVIAMFPNVDPDVCFMILQASDGQVAKTVDTLLDISNSDNQPVRSMNEENIEVELQEIRSGTSTVPRSSLPSRSLSSTEEGTRSENKTDEESLIRL